MGSSGATGRGGARCGEVPCPGRGIGIPRSVEQPRCANMTGAGEWTREAGRGALWLWDHSVGWLLKWVLLALIWLYQRAISPLLPPSCRYHPSCSAYGLTAIARHGSAKGLALATWRLLRCNPWSGGGLDPVPERGRWVSPIYPDGRPRDTGPITQPRLPGRRTT
jgi:putative membrane protein insertion efficiency factor